MIEEAKKAILESSPESSIYIGCDSIYKPSNKKTTFATVVVVHKDSKHGCKIFYKTETLPDYGIRRVRLLQEAIQAASVAQELIEVIGDRNYEVHLDLNPNPLHKSNEAVKEACGYVLGVLGIEAKIKPFSWAAAHCADHIVKKKHLTAYYRNKKLVELENT